MVGALMGVVAPVGVSLAAPPAAYAAAVGTIGDFVWHDVDVDGVQDSWEPGVEGASVALIGADGEMDRTTTDSKGRYELRVFEGGEYAVRFEGLPEGAAFTLQNASDDTERDSDADPGSGQTGWVTIGSGGSAVTGLDAGLVMEGGPPPVYGSIGDRVWQDSNANGIQDEGEWDMPGVTLDLLDSSGEVLDSTQTDGNGAYIFDGLSAGTYYVQVSGLADGWVYSPPGRGGDPERDSNVNPATGRTGTITLRNDGDVVKSVDVGVYVRR